MLGLATRPIVQSIAATAVAIRTSWPARQPSPTKITGFEECDHCFLSLVGNDAELHLSVLDVKDGIRRGALGKDDLPLAIGRDRHAAIERSHECTGIEW